MSVGDRAADRSSRSYQHRAAGATHALDEAARVPGRVHPQVAAVRPPDPGATALRSARGALARLAAGVDALDEATRDGRAASPMLVLDVRSALTRADAAIAQGEAETGPAWDEARQTLRALGPRAGGALDAQAALATPDAAAAALAADAGATDGHRGLGRVDVATEPRTPVAFDDAWYLHPPTAETRSTVRTSDGPAAAADAHAYLAATPLVGDAIRRGTHAATFGDATVRFHATEDAFVQAYVDTRLITEGKTAEQVDRERAAFTSLGRGQSGFADPLRRVAHVQHDSDPCTTIHELLHLYAHQPSLRHQGPNMHEGITDYLTRLVCKANGVPFVAGYQRQIWTLDRLVDVIGVETLVDFALRDAAGVPAIVSSKEPGTWDAFKARFEAEEYVAAIWLLDGVHEANAERLKREEQQRRADKEDRIAADRTQDAAAHAADPPMSAWPAEGTVAEGRITNDGSQKSPPYLQVSAGGNKGVRNGWNALVTCQDGSTVVGEVIDVFMAFSRVAFPVFPTSFDASRDVVVWRVQ